VGAHPLKVFVSSRAHELVDLRAAVKAFLESLGVYVMMSEEVDFPDDGHGLASPYVGCLDTRVVSCSKVFGVAAETTGRAGDRELGRVRDASGKGRALLEGGHPG
jgi:hypothetical protein